MHSDEKSRFFKLFPLSDNPIASYGELVRLKTKDFFLRFRKHKYNKTNHIVF
jgi:hypothetical protein